MWQVFLFATFFRDRLDYMAALGAVRVDFDPLHQANLMKVVTAASIDKVIIFHLLVQAYRTLVLGFALIHHILELVVFILIFILAGLRVGVGAGVGFNQVHHVELPLSLLHDALLHFEPTQPQQVVPSIDVGLDQSDRPTNNKNQMHYKQHTGPSTQAELNTKNTVKWMVLVPLPESDDHHQVGQIRHADAGNNPPKCHIVLIDVNMGEFVDEGVLECLDGEEDQVQGHG